jgi:hypothetical protein
MQTANGTLAFLTSRGVEKYAVTCADEDDIVKGPIITTCMYHAASVMVVVMQP